MRHVVNSRADLENLRGTADFEDVLRGLHGAFTTWSLVDGAWVAQENMGVIERFDYDKVGFLAEIEPFEFPDPVAPDLPPEPPAPVYIIAKNAIWERASDEEAETMQTLLAQQPVRLQQIYAGATYISTDHELYAMLYDALVQAFGQERAEELLEPTG